jgi:hypothetical protein
VTTSRLPREVSQRPAANRKQLMEVLVDEGRDVRLRYREGSYEDVPVQVCLQQLLVRCL